MPEWGIKGKGNTWCSPSWGAEYRELNGYSYPGIVLAAQLFGLKEKWNHDALFDYQDRYMVYKSPEGLHPGNRSLSGFAGNMWDSYRSNIPGTAATPPFAAVVTPGDEGVVSGNINIKAIAYGINRINSVQFYLNGNEIGSEVTNLS
ncbi:MAG: Ig-like domain-containing protein [Halanaerobiales bacterium]